MKQAQSTKMNFVQDCHGFLAKFKRRSRRQWKATLHWLSGDDLSPIEAEQRVQDALENPQPVPPEQSAYNVVMFPVMGGEDNMMLHCSSFRLPKSSRQLCQKELTEQLQAIVKNKPQ
jgi:hypothetical protein